MNELRYISKLPLSEPFFQPLKFVYHDTIVRVSHYTLGIDTSNLHMINDLHKTARTLLCLNEILLEHGFDSNQSKMWL